jgi:hypothetical protein
MRCIWRVKIKADLLKLHEIRLCPKRYIAAFCFGVKEVENLDYSEEKLERSNNPFAQVMVAAKVRLLEGKIPEEDLLEIKLLAATKLQEKGFDRVKIRAIFNFLKNYVLFEKPEMNRKFDKLFKQTDKYNVMNTVEYIRMEAKEEKSIAVAKNLIATTEFSDERIASIVGVPVALVKDIHQGKKM